MIEGVLFTDLDGSLLDEGTYEPGPAVAGLRALQEAGIPVILCSAKTRAEQDALRERLELEDPFIVENGAAVYALPADGAPARVFGLPYLEVRRRLMEAAGAADVKVRGYGDMLVEEVAALTDLDIAQAVQARARDYTEPFVIEASGEPNEVTRLAQECGRRGLRVLRGARFWTASGKHDKGRAVRYVIERYARPGTRPVTYAIGDYWNDRDMLEAADASFLVQRPDGRWADFDIPGLVRIDGIGPAGWLEAAGQVLAAHSQREAG